jgi:hypothetical protein
VTVDKSGEMQYRIVAPVLSSSGDYTPIYALIATSKVGGGPWIRGTRYLSKVPVR